MTGRPSSPASGSSRRARVRRYEKILPLPFVHAIVNLSEPYRLIDPRGHASRGRGCVRVRHPVRVRPHRESRADPARRRRVHAAGPARVQRDGRRRTSRAASSPASAVFDDVGRPRPRHPNPTRPTRRDHRARRPRGVPVALVAAPTSMPTRSSPPCSASCRPSPTPASASSPRAPGVSHKTLIAHFHRACGIAPKQFGEVARFHRFIMGLPLGERLPSWADLVAVSPYYDQPHVIRAFHRFSGYTPAEYLGRVAEFGPMPRASCRSTRSRPCAADDG